MFVDIINIDIKYIWFKNPNEKEKFESVPTSDSKHSPPAVVQIFVELGKETGGMEALALSFCEEMQGKYVKRLWKKAE